MKYNKFDAMIIPFINARWNSIMFPSESKETTVNVSVQQIYNEYKWMWLLEDEALNNFTAVWDNFTKELKYPIKYHLWVEKDWGSISMKNWINDLTSGSYVVDNKDLIVTEDWEYTISYLRDYEFLSYAGNPTLEIPLPDKLIPALYYLVLSQLDLVDVQQLQWQTTSNFSKYQYEIANLKANDIWYESQLISGNAQ